MAEVGAAGDKANLGVVKNKVAHHVPAGYLVVPSTTVSHPRDPLAQAHDVAAAVVRAVRGERLGVGIRVGSC